MDSWIQSHSDQLPQAGHRLSCEDMYLYGHKLPFSLDAALLVLLPLLDLNIPSLFLEIYHYNSLYIFYYYSNWFLQLDKISHIVL